MEKVDVTISIESFRLDVLNYCLGVNSKTTVQKELEKKLEELYIENVSEEMRGYVDSKIKPPTQKAKGKRPAQKPVQQEQQEKTAQGKEHMSEDTEPDAQTSKPLDSSSAT